LDALARLVRISMGDTGQSRRVANFLLAWYNATENGGWDPADLWTVDSEIANDMVAVIGLIRQRGGKYPDDLGFRREIGRIWELWRGGQTFAATKTENREVC
jgi:ParB family transcriptional regulator, chromosome partitioning protein